MAILNDSQPPAPCSSAARRKRVVQGAMRLLGTVILVTGPSSLHAHHSFVIDFDNKNPVEISGVVTKVLNVNPHPRIWVDVTDDAGDTVTWELQGGRGDAFMQEGESVTVTGYAHRRQAASLYIQGIAVDDGRVAANRDLDTGQERNSDEPYTEFTTYHDIQQAHGVNAYPVDITGDWNQRYRGRISIDDLEPQPIPFTDEGRRVYEENHQFGKDPGLRCMPTGIARLLSGPSPFKVYDVGPMYLVLYSLGGTAQRVIYMDGREPPADHALSHMGFSVGRWEGERLIIETTHMKPMWLDVTGLASSGAETRMTEIWEPAADNLTMKRTMIFEDPLYTEPLTRVRYAARDTAAPLGDGKGCVPDQFYQDLMTEGKLESFLQIRNEE